jgi:NAD(P)-dependent dehydrogenase (short-subunit alcohol dehydrogenase family)
MVMRSLAVDLAHRGITCLVINPGWVKTRMGGPNARITAEESVLAMRKVFAAVGPNDSGKFFDYTGKDEEVVGSPDPSIVGAAVNLLEAGEDDDGG